MVIPTLSLFLVKAIRNFFEDQNREHETQFILIEETNEMTVLQVEDLNRLFKSFSDVLQPLVWANPS